MIYHYSWSLVFWREPIISEQAYEMEWLQISLEYGADKIVPPYIIVYADFMVRIIFNQL